MFKNMPIADLRNQLEVLGLDTEGTKSELIEKLQAHNENDVQPNDSASQSGRSVRSSNSSSVRVAKAMETAKKAGLIAKAKKLKEKNANDEMIRKARLEKEMTLKRLEAEHEALILKSQQDNELYEIEAEIEETAARESVLSEFQNRMHDEGNNSIQLNENKRSPIDIVNTSINNDIENKIEPSRLNAHVPEFVPNSFPINSQVLKNANVNISNNSVEVKQLDLMRDMLQYNMMSLAPKIELKSFNGDFTKYKSFIRCFDNMIHSQSFSDSQKLSYLEQFTTGTPNEIVTNCSNLPADIGYAEARLALEHRYGGTMHITNAFVDKILAWPIIKNDDVESLDKFSLLLNGCKNAMLDSCNLNRELEHPKTIEKIIEKLPYNIRERWRRHACSVVELHFRAASFNDVVTFISKESAILNHPIYGKKNVKTEPKDVKNIQSKNSRIKCNAINDISDISCLFCKENHHLENCKSILNDPIEKRDAFIKSKGLCFGCLSRGHLSKYCKKRKKCKICDKYHLTLLHEKFEKARQSKSEEETKSLTVGAGRLNNKGVVKMPIIPVKVQNSNGELITTHAFLDSGSTASFCSAALLDKLKLRNVQNTTVSISTVNADTSKDLSIVHGVTVCDMEENNFIKLPSLYTLNSIPVTHDEIVKRKDLFKWPHLEELPIYESNADIGLLIGNNIPEILEPWEVINSNRSGEPFAVKTKLGWVISGQDNSESVKIKCHRIKLQESMDEMMVKLYNHGFDDLHSNKKGWSIEDKLWMQKIDKGFERNIDKHCEIPLPFKEKIEQIECNKTMVFHRTKSLKIKFAKDPLFKEHYEKFMDGMLVRGHAELVPKNESNLPGQSFYVPHFGVYNPRKPHKIRIVFDFAAKFRGKSLNDHLLQGPDLVTPLIDVLIRFRTGQFAYAADIEQMFFQIRLPKNDRNFTRFFWWKDNDLKNPPTEYRMKVYPFGANCSPSCATYALKRTADDFDNYTSEIKQTIHQNFYVDDILKSLDNEEQLVTNALEVRNLCAEGGFNLIKFVSSSQVLLDKLPNDSVDMKSRKLEFYEDGPHIEKTLGVCWNIEKDEFSINVVKKDMPITRRGILSVIGSVFDPMGFLAPFILKGRLIMQELTRLKLDWDAAVPTKFEHDWIQWLNSFSEIESFSVSRNLKPGMNNVAAVEIHHFSDASSYAYSVVTFIRFIDTKSNIHVSFLYGKSHVAPLKTITIPRLELTAACNMIKANEIAKRALEPIWFINETYYWTDSQSVLKYIYNEDTRFHVFVANRVAIIRENSEVKQWRYVPSKLNPADDGTRGVQSSRWISGPNYLYRPEEEWPSQCTDINVDKDDKEIKSLLIETSENQNPLNKLIHYYSNWQRLGRAAAWMIRVKNLLLKRVHSFQSNPFLSVAEVQNAQENIISYIQHKVYQKEFEDLKNHGVRKSSSLVKLSPILHENLLRVGGRLDNAQLPFSEKHPIILPNQHHITVLIIMEIHENISHQGREHTLSKLREHYWVIKGSSTVRSILSKCVKCRRVQAPVLEQIMSSIPIERSAANQPPFTNTGIDIFGPFYVKIQRSQVKRFISLFTCMTSRAVHLEVVTSMDTSSFINCLRRFIARRGSVKYIRSDQGTNLVAADKELKRSIQELKNKTIYSTLLSKGIEWRFNTPSASHHGGIWEREIRTVRKILDHMLRNLTLTDETLSTLTCEVERIMNSRPLTNVSSDPRDLNPITPNHLLYLNGEVPVIGEFKDIKEYTPKRWKYVQHLADVFWKKWHSEYLRSLQERQKWFSERKNLTAGDIVLILDNNVPRCHWLIGRVTEVFKSVDGKVRSVSVKTKHSVLQRPISKLVLLLENLQ